MTKVVKSDHQDNSEQVTKIFQEHGTFIRNFIKIHVKDETKADEIFQEIFLFLLSQTMPENVNNIRAYLTVLARSRIIDSIRRSETYNRNVKNYADEKSAAEHARIEKFEYDEIKSVFAMIKKCLPKSQASAITLKYKHGCGNDEIAEKLGINGRSVSRYIAVGLKRMRTFLDGERG